MSAWGSAVLEVSLDPSKSLQESLLTIYCISDWKTIIVVSIFFSIIPT